MFQHILHNIMKSVYWRVNMRHYEIFSRRHIPILMFLLTHLQAHSLFPLFATLSTFAAALCDHVIVVAFFALLFILHSYSFFATLSSFSTALCGHVIVVVFLCIPFILHSQIVDVFSSSHASLRWVCFQRLCVATLLLLCIMLLLYFHSHRYKRINPHFLLGLA